MINKSIIGALLISNIGFAQNMSDLLVKDANKKEQKSFTRIVSKIELDDAFLVQSYGKTKSFNIRDPKTNEVVDLFFNKKYPSFLKASESLKIQDKSQKHLMKVLRVYALNKLGFSQELFESWLDIVLFENHFESDLAMALDQVLESGSSKWFIKNAPHISKINREKLLDLPYSDFKFLNSAQAYYSLREAKYAKKSIRKLNKLDPLVIPLAKTIIIDLSTRDQLSKAGEIIKDYVEPYLEKRTNVDEISDYYISVARLLYQARAYEQAKKMYQKVPDESRHFFKARSESLWVSITFDDLSTILGEIKSLDQFPDEFLPERYLMSSMAHLKLCEFDKVKISFDKFIQSNKSFYKLIQTNLESKNPKEFEKVNFYRKLVKNQLASFKNDEILAKTHSIDLHYDLSLYQNQARVALNREIKREWSNKKRLIELSLRKMRFVKVEYLSTMRRLQDKMAHNTQDSVKTITSALNKKDKLEFPYDGILFGDELFHMYSKVNKLCLNERKTK